MSGSTTPTTATDSLWTPQTIIGVFGMAILAGTVAAVLGFGDPQTKAQTVGGVLSIGGAIVAFYFGSSRGSQVKDERTAASGNGSAPAASPPGPIEQPNARG